MQNQLSSSINMEPEQYPYITPNDFKEYISEHYSDSDLSVCFDVGDIDTSGKSVNLDAYLFLACIAGEISGEIATSNYHLRPNDLLV